MHLTKIKPLNKKQKYYNISFENIIHMIVIFLLILLVIISSFSLINLITGKLATNISDPTATFSFIISSYGIFVATAIFLPKFILEQKVQEEVSKQIIEAKKQNEINKGEFLRIEAHECRMTAYFLTNGNKNYEWALGWTFKSLKSYIQLYQIRPYAYEKFINNDLTERLDEIDKASPDSTKKPISIRMWKDFFECLVSFITMGEGYDPKFSSTEIENYNQGYYAIKNFLDKAFSIFIKHLNEQPSNEDLKELERAIRYFDIHINKKIYKAFITFLKNPSKYQNLDSLLDEIDKSI